MVHYIVTKTKAAERTQYGITAVRGQAELDSIDDIAPTFEETARLAALLQENGGKEEPFWGVGGDYWAGEEKKDKGGGGKLGVPPAPFWRKVKNGTKSRRQLRLL